MLNGAIGAIVKNSKIEINYKFDVEKVFFFFEGEKVHF